MAKAAQMPPDSIAARLPAWVLLSLLAVLAGVLIQRPPTPWVVQLSAGSLTAEQVAGAVFPLFFLFTLTISFLLIHWLDRRFGGDGLSDRVLRQSESALVHRGYHYDAQVVQGMLTKQAVFTAIAVALLVAVAGALVFGPSTLPSSQRLLLLMVAAALFLTLLFALASITCYNHALQFQWQERYGTALVRVGSKLDIASFYLLSEGLLLAASLWRPWATYGFGFVFALLLYRYYFFPLKPAPRGGV